MKNINRFSEPKIDIRPEQPTIGIRTTAPFAGMFKVVDKISKDMRRWAREHQVIVAGPSFLRYHVIDMRGEMDITYGFPVREALAADGDVIPGALLAGRYVSLIYSGGGLAGNRALIEWARANGLEFDRWDTEKGDHFSCRYESFLTDPKVEPRKTRWDIEVAIKLK